LLAGWPEAVEQALGIRNLRHRSASLDVCARGTLLQNLLPALSTIEANWLACQTNGRANASSANWRWRAPQLGISPNNASPEVVLERALINACESAGRTDWANQVPVASGVAGSSRERRRAVDLVHQVSAKRFELIELKVGSDTPLYAAMEIASYAMIWLLSRDTASTNPLLSADAIDAVVLAPEAYYARYSTGVLQTMLDAELASVGKARGVELSFRFEAFPDRLAVQPFTADRLLQLADGRRRL
jgi:hypothetical protein